MDIYIHIHPFTHYPDKEKEHLNATESSLMLLPIIDNHYCNFYPHRLLFLVLKGHKIWITPYLCFCDQILFNTKFLIFIHIVECIISLSFNFGVVFQTIHHNLFIHSTNNGYLESFRLGLLWRKLLLSFLYTSFSGHKH